MANLEIANELQTHYHNQLLPDFYPGGGRAGAIRPNNGGNAWNMEGDNGAFGEQFKNSVIEIFKYAIQQYPELSDQEIDKLIWGDDVVWPGVFYGQGDFGADHGDLIFDLREEEGQEGGSLTSAVIRAQMVAMNLEGGRRRTRKGKHRRHRRGRSHRRHRRRH